MKRNTILKAIIILIIGVILSSMPISVFATDLNDFFNTGTGTNTNTNTNTNNDDEFEDKGELSDIKPEEVEPDSGNKLEVVEPTKPTNPVEKEPTLPNAGLAEDTIMIVSIIALIGLAIYSGKKVNDYKNI